jgi:HSP20 family protein
MAKKAKKTKEKGKSDMTVSIHRLEDFSPPSWSGYWGVPSIPDLMAPARVRMPRVDMLDLGDEMLVEVELPGVRSGDVNLSAADNSVNIRACDSHQAQEGAGEYYYREIGRGEYQRVLLLPCGVDWDGARAKLRDGILVLRLPKRESATGETQRQNIPVD